MNASRFKNCRCFSILGLMALISSVVPSIAANTVDLSSDTHWICDSDFVVSLDAKTGVLRTVVKLKKIDESLPYYSCNSSHCDWGNGPEAEQCQEVPCAEILAEEKYQHLWIRLKGFEGRCDAVKSREKQD